MKYILPILLLSASTFTVEAASGSQGTLNTMGISEQGDASIRRPHNAQTKEAVLAQYGEPNNKVAAIGDPPITRWEYSKFNVFFEYDRVIHSVLLK